MTITCSIQVYISTGGVNIRSLCQDFQCYNISPEYLLSNPLTSFCLPHYTYLPTKLICHPCQLLYLTLLCKYLSYEAMPHLSSVGILYIYSASITFLPPIHTLPISLTTCPIFRYYTSIPPTVFRHYIHLFRDYPHLFCICFPVPVMLAFSREELSVQTVNSNAGFQHKQPFEHNSVTIVTFY